MPNPPPMSLREVSERVALGVPYAHAMKEFLDGIRRASKVSLRDGIRTLLLPNGSIDDRPHRLENAIDRAHIGGMAEYMANLANVPPPAWCNDKDHFLDEAVFTCGEKSASLFLAETPAAFRRRNLFCGRAAENLTSLLSI